MTKLKINKFIIILIIGIQAIPAFACDLPYSGKRYSASQIESGNFTVDLSEVFQVGQVREVQTAVSKCKIQIFHKKSKK